jgi:hypothetical protein
MSAFHPLRTLRAAGTVPMMQLSVGEQADAWIALQRYKNADDAPEDVFQRGFRLNDFAYDDPAFTLSVIKDVVSRYAEDDLFTEAETEAKQILAMLGAGPLETLLGENGDQVIADVEAEARRDRRFFWTLACVWQHGMSDDLWGRVQRITHGFSP